MTGLKEFILSAIRVFSGLGKGAFFGIAVADWIRVNTRNSKSKVLPTGRRRFGAGKVLMTAQDLRVAGLIQEYLLETGYEVVSELDLNAALGILVETQIDLLIVDGEMPEKALKDFVETIARLKPELPVIAVGMSEHEAAGKSLSGFVSAFIEKPFSISDISDTIKEVQAQNIAPIKSN